MSKFKDLGLKEEIVKALGDLGFKEPFPIQEESIPIILKGRDLIGQARTGSGKTGAFVLPILQMVKDAQALIITPTRELALQIKEEIVKFSKYTDIKVLAVYGGENIKLQLDILKDGVDIIVSTPGRLIDHIRRGSISLDYIRFVVIDEADKMLEMGFIDDIKFVLNNISNAQILLFSATISNEIYEIARRYMNNPVTILLDKDLPVGNINQVYLLIDRKAKFYYLCKSIKRDKTIIFCATKNRARVLADALQEHGFNAIALHGDLRQDKRNKIMNRFRKGYYNILVATDLAARGIDIPSVEQIINYDVPNNPIQYFHRIGRTARANKKGEALTLVSEYDKDTFERILNSSKAIIKRELN